jgi:hypothetical protein
VAVQPFVSNSKPASHGPSRPFERWVTLSQDYGSQSVIDGPCTQLSVGHRRSPRVIKESAALQNREQAIIGEATHNLAETLVGGKGESDFVESMVVAHVLMGVQRALMEDVHMCVLFGDAWP